MWGSASKVLNGEPKPYPSKRDLVSLTLASLGDDWRPNGQFSSRSMTFEAKSDVAVLNRGANSGKCWI